MTTPSTGHQRGPHPWMRAVTEFLIVFGLCMAALFVVIPAGTAESDNFGLSPRMLPIVTVSVMAMVSVLTLVFGLWRARGASAGQAAERPDASGLRGVVLLVLATFVSILAIDQAGLVAGGTVLVLLAALAIGERRPLILAGLGLCALLILVLVEWSGL